MSTAFQYEACFHSPYTPCSGHIRLAQFPLTYPKGIYGVSVDGKDAQFYSGYSSTDTFQQVLFATTGLEEGDHTIKLSNENAKNTDQYPNYVYLDVDYAAFTGTL